jgi:hypothetical protein
MLIFGEKMAKKENMGFKCPVCGDTKLCWHEVKTFKTPLSFENGEFEGAGRTEEINISDVAPNIRCGKGHSLMLLEGIYVDNIIDMEYWLEERKQIEENL